MTKREIVLEGGPPWGFRLQGGVESKSPLRIHRINQNSKAASKGIREGDLVTSINGHPTQNLSLSDANALVRSSEHVLSLKLLQDSGSPRQRKRNKATIQHETYSETLKSISSKTSSSKTIFSEYSEPERYFHKQQSVEGQHNFTEQPDPPLSPNSTVSSDISSCSTLTEAGGDEPLIPKILLAPNMADKQNSNTRKKRGRNHRKKNSNKNAKPPIRPKTNNSNETLSSSSITKAENPDINETYDVTFPETSTSHKALKLKSKSLDDDDSVNIQEVTGTGGEEENHCQAIISEVDSDWEGISEFRIPQVPPSLSTVAISLDGESLQRVDNLSSEQESSLRKFLQGIQLVNSPETRLISSSSDALKRDKEKTRHALVRYFTPLAQNPRYLDIISEEGSDLSDKETPSMTRYLKQGTPELDSNPQYLSHTSPKSVRKLKRVCQSKTQEAVLVCTKIVEPDTPSIVEHVHTCPKKEEAEVEKVFIESSSECSSRSSLDSSEDNCEKTSETKNAEDDIEATVAAELPENNSSEKEDTLPVHHLEHLDKAPLLGYEKSWQEEKKSDYFIKFGSDLTTDIILAPSKESVENNNNLLKMDESSTQSQKNFNEILKTDIADNFDNKSANELIRLQNHYELTPPPTPDFSPKDKESPELTECLRNISVDAAKEINSVLLKLTQNLTETSEQLPAKSIDAYESMSSPSLSRSSSSSRGTSPSTVRLNPLMSSIADVTSILSDLQVAKEALSFQQPCSLRKLCLNFLLTTPCGADILRKLSDISINLEKLTQAEIIEKLGLQSGFVEKVLSRRSSNNTSYISEALGCSGKNMEYGLWSGVTLENRPNVLLFLSPTQKKLLDKSQSIKNEPEVLLDLHAKFLERSDPHKTSRRYSDIACGKIDEVNLEIDDLSFSKKFSKTLPRNFDSNNARLRASNLGEWLKIVRDDNSSEDFLHNSDKEGYRFVEKKQPEQKQRPLSLSGVTDIYQSQMQYILEKEKEIEIELDKLLEEKKKLFDDILESKNAGADLIGEQNNNLRPKSFPQAPSEIFRQQMYHEYMNQVAEREQRKQQRIIKMSSRIGSSTSEQTSKLETKRVTEIEDEFMQKVQKLQGNLNKKEEEDVVLGENEEIFPSSNEVVLMDDNSFVKTSELPKHLREFVEIASDISQAAASDSAIGVWSPGQNEGLSSTDIKNHVQKEKYDDAIPTIWQPKSATSSPITERKEFRPVSFVSPKLSRKNRSEEILSNSEKQKSEPFFQESVSNNIADNRTFGNFEQPQKISESRPFSGSNDFSTNRLPRAPNPTVTLLQKARDGQLPRNPSYLEASRDHYNVPNFGNQGEIVRPRKIDPYSESDSEVSKRLDSNRKQIEGVGPITRDGMPLSLRSEVKDSNQSKWYKKMYETIHKQRPYKDEYVTVRYKQRRAQYPYITGYLSEPEHGAYDSDHMDYKYATVDRRRTPINQKENYTSSTLPRNAQNRTASSADIFQPTGSHINPGKIENYTPGHSSISDQESKRNFDSNQPPSSKGYMSQALKESGYESDSTLVFRRKENGLQLSPSEQKEAYKIIQKGGDIPLHGLRKPAPEKTKEPESPLPPTKSHYGETDAEKGSPRKYVENQVTIHYKTPVRQEIKEYYSEDELAHRQQEAMKKIYQEERRRKYLQELQDMHSRRHTDNFIPSLKSPIPLNRYDDFDDLVAPPHRIRPRSPEPRLVAKALYNFVGMTPRELTFRKGDNIYVRRQIDKNWYEGELNAMVGLFPVNYVEIVPYENVKTTTRKPHEGQARAKYNFLAKTHLELSLAKGEMVIITRRVDNNWYEGKIGGRRGIFPASYVDVLIDPQDPPKESNKPVAAPAAHSLLLNGVGVKESMGSHTYSPNMQNTQDTQNVQSMQTSNSSYSSTYQAKPVHLSYCNNNYDVKGSRDTRINQALHIDTQSAEPTPFKALYKYLPQNDDELELMEGDTVYVLEKCDDGWFVGSNERTGAFGTFPGNYVNKI